MANVPIIPGVEPFEILSRIDQKKIIGLTIEAERLASIRKKRMEKFHLNAKDTYSEAASIQKEISYAESLYRTPPVWPVIDVTHKSIEEIAQEVITALAKANLKGEKPGNTGEKHGGETGEEHGEGPGEGLDEELDEERDGRVRGKSG